MVWKRMQWNTGPDPHHGTRPTRALKREPWVLLFLLVILFLFWDSPLIQPLKWLAVLFHELSHALVGYLTGGQVISLDLNHREGGICRVAGGNRMLILLAGYPGSLCWGMGALYLAPKDRVNKPVLYALGGLLVVVILLYARPILGFGFLFSLSFALFLGMLAHFGTNQTRRFALVTIGLGSCVYVFQDIFYDVFWNARGLSDATLLFQHTGIPGFIWGILWYGISLMLLGYSLSRGSRAA